MLSMMHRFRWIFLCFLISAFWVGIGGKPVVAQITNFITDTFGRSVTDGWGSADTGGAYTLTGASADFDVAGGAGTMLVAGSSSSRTAMLNSTTAQDTESVFRFRTDKVATGNSLRVRYIGRRVSANNEYRVLFTMTTGQVIQTQVVYLNNTSSEVSLTSNTTIAGLTHVADQWYRARVQMIGTNPTVIRVRVWQDGTTEPTGTWNIEYSDTTATALQTAGSYGLSAGTSSSMTNLPYLFSFDDFTVDTGIAPTATPTVTPTNTPSPTPIFSTAADTFSRTESGSWGVATTGGAYAITSNPGDFAVNGSVGQITTPNAGNSREVRLGQVITQDIDYTVQVRTDKAPAGNYYQVVGLARRSPSVANTEYRLKFQFNTNGSVALVAAKLAGSASEVNIGSSQTQAGVTYTENTWYNLRFQVTNTNPTLLRMKMWPVGNSEPAEWTYSQTDFEPALQASGNIGIRVFTHPSVNNAPVLYEFDNLNVTEFSIPTPTPPASCEPYYTDYGPWREPLPDNPTYNTLPQYHVNDDPDEPLEAFVDTFDGVNYTYENLTSDTTQYTYPVYLVDNSTPTQTVTFNGYFSNVQDTNGDGAEDATVRSSDPDFNGGILTYVDVPIPTGIQAATGSDSQTVIINTDTGEEWGFWRVDKNGDGVGDASGGVINNDLWTPFNSIYYAVNGYRYNIGYTGYPPSNTDPGSLQNFGSRGAGVPYLAGLIRPCEIIQGEINHAIAFAYPLPSSDFVYPATKSDGQGTEPYELPEGARLQLDPTLTEGDLNDLGCFGACVTIAKALQSYGMYLIDISGRYKVMAEDEKTANWSDLNPSYQVTENTVAPLTLDLFRLIEFPAELNELQPIPQDPTPGTTPTPGVSPTAGPSPTGTPGVTGGASGGNSASTGSNSTREVCSVAAPATAPWIFSATSNGINQITLYFQESSDPVTHYALRFGEKSGEYQYGATNIGPKGTKLFTIAELKPDTTYYFQVQGVNSCNGSEWSNEMSFSTKSLLSYSENEYRTENVAVNPVLTDTSTSDSEDSVPTETPTPTPAPVTGSNIVSDVRIQVVDRDGLPLSGARVTLQSSDQGKTTNAQGEVLFAGVQHGEYTVSVQHNGATATQKLAIVETQDTFDVQITLNTTPDNSRWWVLGGGILLTALVGWIIWIVRVRATGS